MSFSWSFLSLTTGGKVTRKEQFLEEMERIIPWGELLPIVEKVWYNKRLWRKKTDALLMLKIFFLQKWYTLADVSIEEEIWDRKSFQKFLNIDAGSDGVPDATTLENFRHALEEYKIGEKLFQIFSELFLKKWLILQQGTSVDATIIVAPSSTKNKEKQRDPEMKQTKKGNQWYFGMKLHCGTDTRSGCIHTLKTSGANEHDSLYFEDCLHGEEKAVFADKAYQKKERIQILRKKGISVKIHRKARKWEKLSKKQEEENRKRSKIRSKTEHPFHIIKNIFGWKKVRYRWLMKNTEHFFVISALTNIYILRQELLKKPLFTPLLLTPT